MSSDSSESERNKKFYLLKSRKNFHIWKEKTLSNASSQGFERFLLEDVKVDTDSDIEKKEEEYIAKDDDNLRRKLRGELNANLHTAP